MTRWVARARGNEVESVHVLLESWVHVAYDRSMVPVLPDGCCDVIVCRTPQVAPRLLFAQPTDRVIDVLAEPGTSFEGLRLCPGVRPREREVTEILSRHHHDLGVIAPQLNELVTGAEDIVETLTLLGQGTMSILDVARTCGVSIRTLRRHITDATGWPPKYWQGLARARRTARLVLRGGPLADIAASAGYADQPHMTRDMRRWFSRTPEDIRAESGSGALSLQVGYF